MRRNRSVLDPRDPIGLDEELSPDERAVGTPGLDRDKVGVACERR